MGSWYLSICLEQRLTTVLIIIHNFFDPNHYQIVAGFNLPLVIEAIMQREQMSLSQLVAHLRQAAIDTIVFQDKYE